MNYPAASCGVSKPQYRTTLKPLQLPGLPLALLGRLWPVGTAWVFALAAHAVCSPGATDRPAAGSLGPAFSAPERLRDRGHTGEPCSGGEPLEEVLALRWALRWHGLSENRPRLVGGPALYKGPRVPLGAVPPAICAAWHACWAPHNPSRRRRTDARVKQDGHVVPLRTLVAQASDSHSAAEAEASFEASDPRN